LTNVLKAGLELGFQRAYEHSFATLINEVRRPVATVPLKWVDAVQSGVDFLPANRFRFIWMCFLLASDFTRNNSQSINYSRRFALALAAGAMRDLIPRSMGEYLMNRLQQAPWLMLGGGDEELDKLVLLEISYREFESRYRVQSAQDAEGIEVPAFRNVNGAWIAPVDEVLHAPPSWTFDRAVTIALVPKWSTAGPCHMTLAAGMAGTDTELVAHIMGLTDLLPQAPPPPPPYPVTNQARPPASRLPRGQSHPTTPLTPPC
jgi:hypothetical protein